MLSLGRVKVKASREELYEQLWSESRGKVAARHRVSNGELKDVCQKYSIPMPNAIYWLAKRSGEPAIREPLPPWSEPPVNSQAVGDTPTKLEKHNAEDDEIAALVRAEDDPANQIIVHEELHFPHPAVKRTKEALKDSTPDSYNRLRPSYQATDVFRFQVTKDSVNRGLRILDALAKALTKRGHTVNPSRKNKQDHDITILDHGFVIAMREKVRRLERKLTPKEEEDMRRWGFCFASDRYSYQPTGILEVQIFWNNDQWSPLVALRDTQRQPLEQRLNRVVIELLRLVTRARAGAVIRRQEEARRAEQERLRKEEERRKKIEEARANQLQQTALQWSKVMKMWAYVEAVQEESLRRGATFGVGDDVAAWLHWAESYLEQIDPLNTSRTLPGFMDAERAIVSEEINARSPAVWSSSNAWQPPRHPR